MKGAQGEQQLEENQFPTRPTDRPGLGSESSPRRPERGRLNPLRPQRRRSQAARRTETERALREAGLQLFAERGFENTTVDEIARQAGLSPRTFFNYFSSKEDVARLPRNLLAGLLRETLLARPPEESTAVSVAISAVAALDVVSRPPQWERARLLRTGIRLSGWVPYMRREVFEGRSEIERVTWQTLLERGVARDDIAARTAVTVVIAVGWQALHHWALSDGRETLAEVATRCLRCMPNLSDLPDPADVLPPAARQQPVSPAQPSDDLV